VTSATLIAPLERLTPAVSPDSKRTYTCSECGHVLRVSGLGRHRVYFELTDERADDPVMNRVCPACGHGLPGKNSPWPQS
jgi:rubrerythrin